MIINPSNLCFLQGCTGFLCSCLPTGIGKIWEQTCTCGVCLCTNTPCFFLETVPHSCKIEKQDNFGESTGRSPKDWSYPKPTKVVLRPPTQAECGRRWHHRRGRALSLKSIFFKNLLFQVLQHLDMNLPLGSWFFSAHKHHTYKHYSNSLQHAGDLSHRSLGKPETYGDHINGDLLVRTCPSWAMWCCSTTVTVWYRLNSQKSVYHAGVHSMYWE